MAPWATSRLIHVRFLLLQVIFNMESVPNASHKNLPILYLHLSHVGVASCIRLRLSFSINRYFRHRSRKRDHLGVGLTLDHSRVRVRVQVQVHAGPLMRCRLEVEAPMECSRAADGVEIGAFGVRTGRRTAFGEPPQRRTRRATGSPPFCV
jgi:hypothetical protein